MTSWVTSPATSLFDAGPADVRRDGLLDQPDLAVRRHLEGPQMAPVDAVLGHPAGGDRQRQLIASIVGCAVSWEDDLGAFQLGERRLGQAAGFDQIGP